METISVTIDGRQIQASPGMTLLAAARAAGIYLPALCAHPSLPSDSLVASERVYRGRESFCPVLPEPVTGCGLCRVEVEGKQTFYEACATLVQPGLSVQTDSSPVRKISDFPA